MKCKPGRREFIAALRECQGLFGSIAAAYGNDRAIDRAERLQPLWIRGFELCLEILSEFPPEGGKRKSGLARAASLTPARRIEIAKLAANARWGKKMLVPRRQMRHPEITRTEKRTNATRPSLDFAAGGKRLPDGQYTAAQRDGQAPRKPDAARSEHSRFGERRCDRSGEWPLGARTRGTADQRTQGIPADNPAVDALGSGDVVTVIVEQP